MRRIVLLAIACLLLIGLSLAGCGPAGQPVVTFPDPNLEAAMREALNIPFGPIHASDLAGLASLSASWRGIEDLSGLQYCTNLTGLNLWANQINDISPPANLTNLTYLYLGANQISDISPLTNLTNLTGLDLCANQMSDISSLANLANLTCLYLHDNQISDISSLASLTNLTNLNLCSNQINDISPLVENAGLSEGDYVHLDENPLSSDSINIYIPQLEARGVSCTY